MCYVLKCHGDFFFFFSSSFFFLNQQSFCAVYGCKNSQLHAAFFFNFWLCVSFVVVFRVGGSCLIVFCCFCLLLLMIFFWRKTRLMEQGSAFYFTLTSKTNEHWKYDHFWFPVDQLAIDKQIRKQN